MRRPAVLGLVCLFLFLAAVPLGLVSPGLPTTFKADEAAYYLMASSLAHDGDLVLDEGDVERLFREFPYRPVKNLIVMTDDGWHTVHFGKPYVYSLFAAPLVALLGANGMLLTNMLLMLAMVAMGTSWLARANPGGPAALFSAGFFLASAGFAYVFWLQPEVFNMASVTAALYLGLRPPGRPGERGPGPGLARAALAGAVLAPAVYNKPMLAALGLPVLFELLRGRRWRAAGAWLAGAAVGLAAVAGLALALSGHATPYLGVQRQGVTVCEPGVMPIGPGPEGGAAPLSERPTGGAWSWIFHLPDVAPGELAENLGYFLWGRHTGLLLYFPFSLIALLLFALGRRRGRDWVLLASLAGVALFFLLFIPHNWQGGGGFVGNRYFVNAYPGFLFLVGGLRPRWLTAAGWALGGLLLGPLLLQPFARGGPEPTLQSHVRNFPFPLFPLELSLREVPGYHQRVIGAYGFRGRRDVTLPRGDGFWVQGATAVELWMIGNQPLGAGVFRVASPAPGNRVVLELGRARQEVVLGGPGQPSAARVTLAPGRPDRVRRQGGNTFYVYRLEVTSDSGRVRSWTRRFPPESCAAFPSNESWEESFYLGAEVTYLGRAEDLAEDVFAVRWGRVTIPETVRAGEELTVGVRLVNASRSEWAAGGAARVKLAYHWLDPAGEVVHWEGERSELGLPVPPDGVAVVDQRVVAPAEPGRYLLELDPIYEQVSWFSQRDPAATYRAEVEVLAAESE